MQGVHYSSFQLTALAKAVLQHKTRLPLRSVLFGAFDVVCSTAQLDTVQFII